MTTANLDAADLAAQPYGGVINEDTMQAVFDISRIPLPFTDRVGSERSSNQFKEWVTSRLPDPDITNAVVDGSDASTPVQNLTERVGNRHQILEYTIAVSTRARNVDTIGYSDELARQITEYNQAIRRDLEAIALYPQASVVDDGNTTAGKLGGFPSWLTSNTSVGATTGADGGFNTGTGLVDAPVAGDVRPLTDQLLRDTVNKVWKGGGNPTIAMSVPDLIAGLSMHMFDESARIATLRKEAEGFQQAKAVGSVNLYLTDHGVSLELVSNRLQQLYNTDTACDLLIIDPEYVALSYIHAPRVDPIGKPGLSDKRQLSTDATVVVHNESAHGVVRDLDPTATVTAI